MLMVGGFVRWFEGFLAMRVGQLNRVGHLDYLYIIFVKRSIKYVVLWLRMWTQNLGSYV